MKIQLVELGEKHPAVAASYINIGGVYGSLLQYDQALEFYQKALKIQLQVLDKDHIDIATNHNNIGLSYNNLKQYDKALNFINKL